MCSDETLHRAVNPTPVTWYTSPDEKFRR